MAEPFALSQAAISKHLKVLEAAGLVSQGRAAQSRPRRLEALRLKEVFDWVEAYRRHWEPSFDRFDSVLTELQQMDCADDAEDRKE